MPIWTAINRSGFIIKWKSQVCQSGLFLCIVSRGALRVKGVKEHRVH